MLLSLSLFLTANKDRGVGNKRGVVGNSVGNGGVSITSLGGLGVDGGALIGDLSDETVVVVGGVGGGLDSAVGKGNVAGSFTIALPDGRIQTTTYTADHYNGFIAEVTYEGTPVYPEAPKGGYGHPAVAHHAPLVAHAPVLVAPPHAALHGR